MQIKQPRFDSVNAGFSLANVIVELLRTKNVHEASVLRFGWGGALGRGALKNMDHRSILQRNGETAFAISPDNAEQGLRFGILPPHLILRSGVFAASRRMKGASELASWVGKGARAPCPPS